MSFFNVKKAAVAYESEPMKGNIERLADFDAFHCLLSGSLGTSIKLKEKYPLNTWIGSRCVMAVCCLTRFFSHPKGMMTNLTLILTHMKT